jgi:hypothetical protein
MDVLCCVFKGGLGSFRLTRIQNSCVRNFGGSWDAAWAPLEASHEIFLPTTKDTQRLLNIKYVVVFIVVYDKFNWGHVDPTMHCDPSANCVVGFVPQWSSMNGICKHLHQHSSISMCLLPHPCFITAQLYSFFKLMIRP